MTEREPEWELVVQVASAESDHRVLLCRHVMQVLESDGCMSRAGGSAERRRRSLARYTTIRTGYANVSPNEWRNRMKLRRLIPLAIAAFGAWRSMSPQQKASIKNRMTAITGRSQRA